MPCGKITLVLDCCGEAGSLSYDEFVMPVEEIVRRTGHIPLTLHYRAMNSHTLSRVSSVILCGTPLMDNDFSSHPESFRWIQDASVPVLGICAGMEAISLAFGGRVTGCEEIGMTDVIPSRDLTFFSQKERFLAFELHRYAACPPSSFIVLARSAKCIQAMKHPDKPVFGVMFHPEVRNEWVIERFLDICPDSPDTGPGV